jgi:hypothetical protein
MQFRPIFAGIAGAWALAAAGMPAFAQTAGETAAKWGLPGEWKLDCKSPASQRNQAIEFTVRGGVRRRTGVVVPVPSALRALRPGMNRTEA